MGGGTHTHTHSIASALTLQHRQSSRMQHAPKRDGWLHMQHDTGGGWGVVRACACAVSSKARRGGEGPSQSRREGGALLGGRGGG